jgi:hypothetical protein
MVLIYSNSPRLVFLYPAAFCSTRNGVLSCFSSAEWFRTEFRQFVSTFVPRNRIPSCFFFRGRVRSQILRVCFHFCSTEQNSEFFSIPRKGSERNFERFLFRGTAGIPSEMIICSVYSVFHRIIFCRKFPTLVITHYYLLLVFPSVLMSLLLLVYPAVPVFSCAAVGQSGSVFLLLLFFH